MKSLFCLSSLWLPSALLLALNGIVQAEPEAPAHTITPLSAALHRIASHGKAEIKQLAQGKNAFIGHLTLAPKVKVPLHRDSTEEYIYVLSGQGRITIDGQTTVVKPETLIYMPANAEVSYQNGEQLFSGLQIFAGPGPAQKYQKWTVRAPKTAPKP